MSQPQRRWSEMLAYLLEMLAYLRNPGARYIRRNGEMLMYLQDSDDIEVFYNNFVNFALPLTIEPQFFPERWNRPEPLRTEPEIFPEMWNRPEQFRIEPEFFSGILNRPKRVLIPFRDLPLGSVSAMRQRSPVGMGRTPMMRRPSSSNIMFEEVRLTQRGLSSHRIQRFPTFSWSEVLAYLQNTGASNIRSNGEMLTYSQGSEEIEVFYNNFVNFVLQLIWSEVLAYLQNTGATNIRTNGQMLTYSQGFDDIEVFNNNFVNLALPLRVEPEIFPEIWNRPERPISVGGIHLPEPEVFSVRSSRIERVLIPVGDIDLPEPEVFSEIWNRPERVLMPLENLPSVSVPRMRPRNPVGRTMMRRPSSTIRTLEEGRFTQRVLTLDRVQRFPTFTADQKSVDDGCVICIDGVEINKPMIRLDCSHFYCSECITKWFEKSRSCPLCKREYHN